MLVDEAVGETVGLEEGDFDTVAGAALGGGAAGAVGVGVGVGSGGVAVGVGSAGEGELADGVEPACAELVAAMPGAMSVELADAAGAPGACPGALLCGGLAATA